MHGSLAQNTNLQHSLSEHPNVPSCSDEDLAFLFPDGRAAQITIWKYKHFYGWSIISLHPAR